MRGNDWARLCGKQKGSAGKRIKWFAFRRARFSTMMPRMMDVRAVVAHRGDYGTEKPLVDGEPFHWSPSER